MGQKACQSNPILGCFRRPFRERAKFCISDLWIDSAETGKGAKAAIGSGNHAISTDDFHKSFNALRNKIGLLYKIRGRVHKAGNLNLTIGYIARTVPEICPFMALAGVRGFEQDIA